MTSLYNEPFSSAKHDVVLVTLGFTGEARTMVDGSTENNIKDNNSLITRKFNNIEVSVSSQKNI